MEIRFVFSAHRLVLIYICTKFHENILNSSRADKIFIGKSSKGYNFIKNITGVTVLFHCILSDDDIFVQSSMKILSTVLKL